jgi:hypothetical protein
MRGNYSDTTCDREPPNEPSSAGTADDGAPLKLVLWDGPQVSARCDVPELLSKPNGIQLTSRLLLEQLLAQCLPGFDHQGETLGPPLLDARLHAMRSDGVDDQCSQWHSGARRAEPS